VEDRLLGLGLNLARQTFESEWMSWYLKDKLDALTPRVEVVQDRVEQIHADQSARQTLARIEQIQKLIEGENGLLRHYETFTKLQHENRARTDELMRDVREQVQRLADVTERQNALGESLKAMAEAQQPAIQGLKAVEASVKQVADDVAQVRSDFGKSLSDIHERLESKPARKRVRKTTTPEPKED
jgi:uncharacterized protein YoxC